MTALREMVEKELQYHKQVSLSGTTANEIRQTAEELVALGYRVESDDTTFGYLVYQKENQ